jgi:DNA-directed RNA polymerase specialized sigma24 family protein
VGGGDLRSNDSSVTGNAEFWTTCWSAVSLSAQSEVPGSDLARDELCRLYWYPLYAFIRRRGYTADDAKDLTQGFFLFLFDRKTLHRANPAKGKFRSFLLASLKNYLSSTYHRDKAIKRGGDIHFVSLDFDGGEDRYSKEPADALTPEKIFDARWAITLLGQAIESLKTEYGAQGKATLFETLKPFLGLMGNKEPPGYESVAEKLKVRPGGVKTLIHRFRKRYAELLRAAVAQTVQDPADIDSEIHALCEALIAAEGQLGP